MTAGWCQDIWINSTGNLPIQSLLPQILFQFLLIASAIGYEWASYKRREAPGLGEAIGILMMLTPALIIIWFALIQTHFSHVKASSWHYHVFRG